MNKKFQQIIKVMDLIGLEIESLQEEYSHHDNGDESYKTGRISIKVRPREEKE